MLPLYVLSQMESRFLLLDSRRFTSFRCFHRMRLTWRKPKASWIPFFEAVCSVFHGHSGHGLTLGSVESLHQVRAKEIPLRLILAGDPIACWIDLEQTTRCARSFHGKKFTLKSGKTWFLRTRASPCSGVQESNLRVHWFGLSKDLSGAVSGSKVGQLHVMLFKPSCSMGTSECNPTIPTVALSGVDWIQ